MTHILASTDPSSMNPATFGVVVIILLQLSQFFFALRKDMRNTESAKKEDLAELRRQLKEEIEEVAGDVRDLKKSVEARMESARMESSKARAEIYNKINDGSTKTAALMESTETLKQSVTALGTKVDNLIAHTVSHAPRKA